jgi:hypothetical protein
MVKPNKGETITEVLRVLLPDPEAP